MTAQIIRFPRTARGRQALRETLDILRPCGPAPPEWRIAAADWDQIAVAMDDIFPTTRTSDNERHTLA